MTYYIKRPKSMSRYTPPPEYDTLAFLCTYVARSYQRTPKR